MAALVFLVLLGLGALYCSLLYMAQDGGPRHPVAESYIDDASALNATRIEEIWPVPEDPSKVEDQLRRLLARASESGTQVSIAGARHTMGGHTIARDGIVINMLPMNSMQLSEDGTELWVQAGARWCTPHRSIHPRPSKEAVPVQSSAVHGAPRFFCACFTVLAIMARSKGHRAMWDSLLEMRA